MAPESTSPRPPGRPGALPRKMDLFATFVLALTVGAIVSQVAVIIWLGSR